MNQVRYINTSKYNPADLLLKYATEGSAAVDVRLAECVRVKPGATVPARTGLYLEMPETMAALLLPRSGLGSKGLVLANTVGLIDSDYRGEITLMLHNRNTTGKPIHVEEGDRAAQMLFIPILRPELILTDKLSQTKRGDGGFGSTGSK